METIIHEQKAAYSRNAYIKFINEEVEFDCSDGEYGPIIFPIEKLIEALDLHTNKTLEETLKQLKDGI
jgi:hypothetical protein